MPLVEELLMFFVVFVALLLRLVGLDLEVRLRARRARGLRALSEVRTYRALDGLPRPLLQALGALRAEAAPVADRRLLRL